MDFSILFTYNSASLFMERAFCSYKISSIIFKYFKRDPRLSFLLLKLNFCLQLLGLSCFQNNNFSQIIGVLFQNQLHKIDDQYLLSLFLLINLWLLLYLKSMDNYLIIYLYLLISLYLYLK